MALKATLALLPNRDPGSVTITTVVDDVLSNNIAIYTGATVSLHRQLEIFNAWWQLWYGIRDRNIMQQFAGIVYSGMDIDHIGEGPRRTDSVLANFTDDDIIIGMGAGVCIDFHDAVETINSGYDRLINTVLETTFKVS